MGLSTTISYLLSRNRGEGQLVSAATDQTIVPLVPPGVEFTMQKLPGAGNYAAIAYEGLIHPDMIPDAFWASFQYGGNQEVAGTLTGHWIGLAREGYSVITRKQPAILTVRNQTNVSQMYGGITFFVLVKTEGDFKEVMKELEWIGSKETNQLLTSMLAAQGVPRPPAGGM